MTASTAAKYRVEVIHLYRALLRESTYLPDPQARTYLWSHIVNRFQESKNKKVSNTKERQAQSIQNARQSLGVLQDANNGKVFALRKVLFYSYGRRGKRRHELLRPLVQFGSHDLVSHQDDNSEKLPAPAQEPPASVASILVKQATSARQHHLFEPQLPSKLKALLQSQVSAGPPEYARSRLSPILFQLKLPEKNRLGRKLPRSRIANIVRDWYGSVLERTLPPLPDNEWYRLRGLISGDIKWEGPRKRRPCNMTSKPTVTASPELILNQALNLAPDQTRRTSPSDGDHHLTLRYMKRLWTMVLCTCPLMVWDPQSKSWTVHWGHRSVPEAQPFAVESDARLFDYSSNGRQPGSVLID